MRTSRQGGIGPGSLRLATVMVAVVAVTGVGCSSSKPSAAQCQTVQAPLSDIPTRTDQEPKMRMPVPPGWERSSKMDSENIRFAIRNQGLAADGFTPNAVVTLQRLGAEIGKPQQILEAQNQQLVKKLKATDLSSTPADVCGSPAMSSSYTAPEVKLAPKIPPIPPRKATSLGIVYKDDDATYVATVTVQSVKPDDPTYAKDAETILKGFQLLPPK